MLSPLEQIGDSLSQPWFGLYLPQIRMPFETIAARSRAAEEAGFDSVWFMDHLWAPAARDLDAMEGWTVATAVAARTQRIRIGHLVLCDAFRPPGLLAKMAATLDVVSGGRLDLGIGWGSVAEELVAFGIADPGPAGRAARLDETLTVLGLLMSGEEVDFDGRFHRLRGAVCRPPPVQRPIPIHVGGGGRRLTMPLVRRHAAWWNCPSYAVDRLDELIPLAGDARVSVQHPVALLSPGDDVDEQTAIAQRRFGRWGGLIVGAPDQVAEKLSAEVLRGVGGFVIQLADFGRTETIERFAAEVIPEVARCSAGTGR